MSSTTDPQQGRSKPTDDDFDVDGQLHLAKRADASRDYDTLEGVAKQLLSYARYQRSTGGGSHGGSK